MADRSVKIVVSAQVNGYVNGMRTAKGATEDFVKRADGAFQRNRKSLDELAGSATKVGLGLVGMAAFAGKAALDWETAWTGVTKTVDGSAKQMGVLEDQLRDLATSLPATHTEIAAVAEAAGQLGVKRDDIAAFTKTMIDLSETTNLTADEAATSIAQLMNVMQTAPDDVDNLGAALVALGNDGASTERDIIQMAQNLAGAGATVGLSEQNVLGLSNALASVGIEAEAGGSAVSKILIDMAKAAKTGSPALATFAETAGMTADQFKSLMETDPAQAFEAFTKGLGRVNAEGGDVFSLLQQLGQSDVRVTRALLGMANAGDLLADSLALGDKAWQQNTALAAEAAKRYDTTAAQAQIAWNNIKDNAIDAGQAILPVISSISDVVVTMSQAFGSLPGPVKSSLGLLAGAVGGTLLVAAAFTKVYGAVTDARGALLQISTTSPRAAGALGRIGSAATVAAGAIAALKIAAEFAPEANIASTSKYTQAILQLGDNAAVARDKLDDFFTASGSGGASVRGLEDALKIANQNDFLGFLDRAASGFGIWDSSAGVAAESITQYDNALTSLVNSGAVEQAELGFREFSAAGKDAGLSSKAIKELLPGYTDALKDSDNQSRISAEGTKDLTSALDQQAEVSDKARDAARQQAEGLMTLGDGLNDSKVSLKDWIKQLQDQADAVNEFASNAKKAAKRGLDEGLIASLEEAGPAGAMRLQQLANASKSELAAANKAWRSGQSAIENYTNVLLGIPAVKTTTIKANINPAAAEVNRLKNLIVGMDGSVVHVKVVGSTGGGITKNADGGFHERGVRRFADGGVDEYGRSVPRESQMRSGSRGVVMWGEAETGWEAYVSGKPGKRDKNRAVAAEAVGRLGGSVQWFADGGFTEAVSARELTSMRIRVRDLKRSLRETEKTKHGRRHTLRGLDRLEARQELREAEAELAEQKKIRRQVGRGKKYRTAGAYNRAMQAREDAATAADGRRGVASSFTDGLDGDAFKSPASLERALATMLRDSAEFTTLLASLRKAGASPWLLEQVMKAGPSRATNRTIRALLGDTARLKRLNAMSAGIVTTGNQYAALTSGKGFASSFSGSSGFSQAALTQAMSQVSLAPSSVAALGDYLLTTAATTSGRQLDYRAREAAMSVALGGAWTGGVS